MTLTPRRLRRFLAGSLSLTTLGVALALPLVDALEPDGRASIEAAHEPGRCGYSHDHAACEQFARSHATHVPLPLLPSAGLESLRPGISRHLPSRVTERHGSTLPRAPPSIG